jgi:hypothetical protein
LSPYDSYFYFLDKRPLAHAFSASTPPELRWFWSVTEIVPAVLKHEGHPATREEAMAKFRDAWMAKAGC